MPLKYMAIRKSSTLTVQAAQQGSQFTSEEYIGLAKTYSNLQISINGKGRAIDNVFIERFFRTIKHEKIYLCLPEDRR
jgi:putative transposase